MSLAVPLLLTALTPLPFRTSDLLIPVDRLKYWNTA